jgi:hypothetical protein
MEGKRNPCLDAARAELESAGVRNFILVHGAKHPQLRWSINGHPLRILTLPGSSSDWRSPRNVRRDVRALLRLDGVLDMPNINTRTELPSNWPQQLRALARMINRVNIPDEHVAERDEIVAALRKLADRTIEGSGP